MNFSPNGFDKIEQTAAQLSLLTEKYRQTGTMLVENVQKKLDASLREQRKEYDYDGD